MEEIYVGENVPGNEIWNGTHVQYLTDAERTEYRLQVTNGLICDAQGNPFDTADAYSLHTDKFRAIFVMDEEGAFYASKHHGSGEFHHSSLISGGPVAAAGEIEVENGRLIAISDKSGHYRPRRAFMHQALDELGKKGVDLSDVQLVIIASY